MQGRQRFASQSLVTCGSELNIGVPSANLQSKMRKTKQLGKNTTQHKKILINAKHGQIIFFCFWLQFRIEFGLHKITLDFVIGFLSCVGQM